MSNLQDLIDADYLNLDFDGTVTDSTDPKETDMKTNLRERMEALAESFHRRAILRQSGGVGGAESIYKLRGLTEAEIGVAFMGEGVALLACESRLRAILSETTEHDGT